MASLADTSASSMTTMHADHEHAHASAPAHDHDHGMFDCAGNPGGHGGGSLIGHIAPGSLFIVWGVWWAYNVCLRAAVTTTNRLTFSSAPFYRFPSKRFQLVEPCLKIVAPMIALSMELFLDHLSEARPYQSLYCPKGTKLAGEFAGENVNNWQHAASYPAVIASGFVDVLSHYVELPPGVTRAFSSMWVGIMALLMFVHEKHEALDKMAHWLLAVSMLLVFAFQVLEMQHTKSVVVSMGKAASTIFLGAWLAEIGVMMYTGAVEWTSETSRGVGAMLAPIFFCMLFLTICLGVLCLYVMLAVLQRRGLVPGAMVASCVDGDDMVMMDAPNHTQRSDRDVRRGMLHHKNSNVTNQDRINAAELGGLMMGTERSFDSDSAHAG